jgi:hypothetical protein
LSVVTTSNTSPKPKRPTKSTAKANTETGKSATRARAREQKAAQDAGEGLVTAVVAKATKPPRAPRKPAIASLPDADPPETMSKLAGEYIGLTIAGGMIAGVLIGAMLPRLAVGRWFRRSGALAVIASEIGATLATQAISRAGAAASESRERIADLGGNLGSTIVEGGAAARENTVKLAGDAASRLADAAGQASTHLVKLAGLAGHAIDGLDVAGSIRHAAEESGARARGAGAAIARKATNLVAKARG